MRPELLAPAGSPESLRAAVQNGADAVYLGWGDFNARRSAKNFSDEEFKEALVYCHARGVRVFLTLNTLLIFSFAASRQSVRRKSLANSSESGMTAAMVPMGAVEPVNFSLTTVPQRLRRMMMPFCSRIA